ncbi:GTP cyclohydrolase I [Leucobacter soli]|uniref:GTP cyclohydrolase 1 n=1 Tax=Leucobacter soli TaxID=2812850 RepID=A0A916NWX0_9MICO|nr:GTP cyclohydrolase I [Leucobacter soli]CAG7620505.1 GTP cyclohydrolase 1 [Leucobacter soli]
MSAGVDRERIAAAVRELLSAIGEDPLDETYAETPGRVAEAYAEFFAGVGVDPLIHLRDTMPIGENSGELVLLRDITLRSVCEHHLLPFRGRAHVAYRPGDRVAGLGAIPRVVATLAARPQLQERLGEQIAEALETGLDAAGVLVVLEASHGCVSDRGAQQAEARVVSMASRGVFTRPVERAEVLTLLTASEPGRGRQ